MQPISAADALGLAFQRTRLVLAPGPLRLGRFFKLALLAALTQATFLSLSISYPLQGGQIALLSRTRRVGQHAFAGHGLGALGAAGIGIVLAILALTVLFSLAYLYVLCRCRATLFTLVLARGAGRVRDAWRSQSRSALRYLGVFLIAGLAYSAVMAAVLGPLLVRFARLMSAGAGANVTPQIGSLMLTLALLVWLLLLPVWIAIDALLQDFVLPGMVLEPGLPLGAAFARMGGVWRRAPGQLLLFLLLRTVVALVVAMAFGLVLLIAVGLLALCEGGVGWVLYRLLWSGGLGAHALFFAAVAGLVLVVLGLYLVGITAIYGVTGTFKACYGACFYAGSYPELAARLGQTAEPALTVSLPEVQAIPSALW